jgi:XRE family transcriptional regulator, regulator of sulfur utilization
MSNDKGQLADQFGKCLRINRMRSGLSQEELGFRASLHRTEIGLLERGEREPKLNTIVKLTGALGVSLNELCGGISWKRENSGVGEFEFRDLHDSPAMFVTRGLGK